MKGFELLSTYLLGGVTLLVVLTILVIVHEYGHFLAAKLFGMKVDAFAVMMGGRRATDLGKRLTKPLVSVWMPIGLALFAIIAILVGATVSSRELVTIALGVLALPLPVWIASRIGTLYGMPASHWLKYLGIGWVASIGLLFFATRFSGVTPDVALSMMLYGSMLGLMILYYQPVMRKPEDSAFGDGELEIQGETVPVQFRPLAAMKTKQGTEFSLLLLPLGGFAAIKGMHPKPDGSEVHIEGGFYSKPPWQRWLVLFAGPLFSVVFGVVLLATVFALYGVEKPDNRPIIGSVSAGNAADKAGLKPKDRVIAINGEGIKTFYDMILKVRDSKAQPLVLSIERGGRQLSVTTTPKLDEAPTPVLGPDLELTKETRIQSKIGIGPSTKSVSVSLGEAFRYALIAPVRMATGLLGLIKAPGKAKEEVGSIGTLAKVSTEAAQAGLQRVLELAGLLSISLGFMNLLPIPPLDGGQMLVAFIEMLRRGKRLSIEVQNAVSTAGFAIVLVLMFAVMAVDVSRFVGGK